MKRITILLAVIALLLLVAGSALAMSSTNYRMDWFIPMTGGGGTSSSAEYAANFTVGQTVVGASASDHFGSGLGYWYGLLSDLISNFLALVMKSQ